MNRKKKKEYVTSEAFGLGNHRSTHGFTVIYFGKFEYVKSIFRLRSNQVIWCGKDLNT